MKKWLTGDLKRIWRMNWLDINWPKVKISSFWTRFYLVMSILFMYVLCFYILISIFKLSRIQNGAPCSEHAVGSWVEDPPLGPPSVQRWAEPMHHVTCAACKVELKPRDQEVVPSGRRTPELTSSHQWSWRVHWWKKKRSFPSGSEKKTKILFSETRCWPAWIFKCLCSTLIKFKPTTLTLFITCHVASSTGSKCNVICENLSLKKSFQFHSFFLGKQPLKAFVFCVRYSI